MTVWEELRSGKQIRLPIQSLETTTLVFGWLHFHLGRRQLFPGLNRICRCLWPLWRFGRLRAGFANLDALVLVVEHDVGGAVAHAAAGLGLMLVVAHFQFGKVRLN